ncbi:MAG: fibronectin type III domain-containing protein, partial [Casimicrobiaceae bacterium]
MKNSASPTLALLACMGIGLTAPVPSPAQIPQTPITVQVINDSGLPDSAVYLLVAGQDVNAPLASGQVINYPFAVSGGVAATPVGTVTNTTSALVTNAGTTPAASAGLTVSGAASTIGMSFAPGTIVTGQTTTLTITLPITGAPQLLSFPFNVAMPSGLTISPTQNSGTCAGVAVTPTQISIPAGTSMTNSTCTIVVTVAAGMPGAVTTVTASTSVLQTAPAIVDPASAPLTVVAGASAVTMSFQPASIAAVRNAAATLTINVPNATGSAQTLSAPFTDIMPTAVVVDVTTGNSGTCTGVTLVATQITMQSGATIPPAGCTIVVSVSSVASGSALAGLAQAGQVTSPYTGNPRTVYEFSMSTVSSGNLFISYNQPVAYPPAPTVTANYRFQPLEFSYSNAIVSNGDLTSIDFYGIPLELQTFASTDAALQHPLDRVTYYTSTPTLRRAFVNVNPDLQYAFVGTSGAATTVFNPGGPNPYDSFLRIIGPNQLAAPGTSPLPSGAPTGNPKPWPYPSFAGYLDALANNSYTFNEVDNGVISAYTFNYSGSITKVKAGTDEPCVPGGKTVAGWLIKLTGTTQAPSPLPSDAEICIPLPATDPGTGSADFFIYGAVQNCEALSIYPMGGLPTCQDTDAATLAVMSNSVYGWIQADVLAALNFGYMQGSADTTTGNVGYSNVWYNLPPVQYPFGLARKSPDDGNYNPWAALMYNHSDAYGFAFSDRKGRPSPDIAYPIGGTLRIWILPDQRLDAPMVAAGAAAGGSTDNSIPLAWTPVDGADHYVVTWSPPYVPASATVKSTSYSIPDLQPGTPYAITVAAYNASGSMRSYEMPIRAMTAGAAATPTGGNANFQFGVNWNLPTYPQLPAPQPVTLTPQSATLAVTSAAWFVDMTFFPATIAPNGSALM